MRDKTFEKRSRRISRGTPAHDHRTFRLNGRSDLAAIHRCGIIARDRLGLAGDQREAEHKEQDLVQVTWDKDRMLHFVLLRMGRNH